MDRFNSPAFCVPNKHMIEREIGNKVYENGGVFGFVFF